MSKQPMNIGASLSRVAGYYGKMPLAGDFVTRRVAQQTVSIWDTWLRYGLLDAKNAPASGDLIERHQATVWNFLVPPAVAGEQLIGLIGNSRDRVGRQYPFTIFETLAARTGGQFRLDHVAPFFMRHGPIVRALQLRQINLEQLGNALEAAADWQVPAMTAADPDASGGDIFAVLGGGGADNETTVAPPPGGLLPWPGLALTEVMLGNTSYWWTNQAVGGPLRAFTHNGGLNEALFKILFAPLSRW